MSKKSTTKLKAATLDSNDVAMAPWLREMNLGVPTAIQSLPCGDAWLAVEDTIIIVERKTPSDLLGSIQDGRLFQQVAAMVTQSAWSYLCITGSLNSRAGNIILNGQMTKWNARSVQGALTDVQELGCGVVYCESDHEYGSTLQWLANRDRGEKHIKARRAAVMQTPQEMVLCSLPNISETRAKSLLEHHGTLAEALVGLTRIDTEDHAPGIGRGTKQAVRAILGLTNGSQMFIGSGGFVSVEIGDNDGRILVDSKGWEEFKKILELAEKGKQNE